MHKIFFKRVLCMRYSLNGCYAQGILLENVMHKVFYYVEQYNDNFFPGDWNKGFDREALLQDRGDPEGVGQEGDGGGRTVGHQ